MNDARFEARLLRSIVVIVWALGAAAIAFALIPSVDIYAPTLELVETRSAVEHPWGMALYGAAVLLPGLVLWRRPQLIYAFGWSVVVLGATMLWLVATDGLLAPQRWTVIHHWQAEVFNYTVVLLVGGLIVALPVLCGAFAFVTRPREAPRRPLPVARVIRR